jgi:hypothetical protein
MVSHRLAVLILVIAAFAASPARAQSAPMSCSNLPYVKERIGQIYGPRKMPFASPELADGVLPAEPQQRLDQGLLELAVASYNDHNCKRAGARGWGPTQIVVIDFARPASQPRLYAVDLMTGQGIDMPVQVAHGIGSDPNDDGVADRFSNLPYSLMSSLGAARGAELYNGINGPSLRLDGLDASNSAMRVRDIVAHSYQPERRRYFNASLLGERRGNPGTSEGCIVVTPALRDWLFNILRGGGFLYSGLGGERSSEMFAGTPLAPVGNGSVTVVPGTGATPTAP